MKRLFLQLALLFPFFGYMVYSYTLVDPNLVLSSFPPYWALQQQLWQIGYHQRDFSSVLFGVLVTLMIITVYAVLRWCTEREKIVFMVGAMMLLFFSHNALSHDLFNYLFNARMVVQYRTDPHLHTALEFMRDDWTRFMHNTHTPAPYGYGWTVLSLLPYVSGLGKFITSYFSMKMFMLVGFVGLWFVMHALAKHTSSKHFNTQKWLFFLSPLVLIETFSSGHNDIWMMLFAYLSYWCAFAIQMKDSGKKKVLLTLGAIALLLISASIKFATLLLFPILGMILVVRLFKKIPKLLQEFSQWWPELSALLLFVPLLTDRSQQFHPWYLLWSLSFLPFMRSAWLRWGLIALSISSLFRYLPFIFLGNYTAQELTQEKMITWVGGGTLFFIGMVCSRYRHR